MKDRKKERREEGYNTILFCFRGNCMKIVGKIVVPVV